MFYYFLTNHFHNQHITNLFSYITFRASLAMLMSLIISFMIGGRLIKMLKFYQASGQPIRTDGPQTHILKAGTPTMGGIMIIFSTALSTLIFCDLSNIYILVLLFTFMAMGLIGFIDDARKIASKSSNGLSAKLRFACQILISIIAYAEIQYYADSAFMSKLTFPFFKNMVLDLGAYHIIFAIFVIVGSANAVNLTDGLDGLASGTCAIVAASFALIAYIVGNVIYSNYLQIPYIENTGEISIFCSSLVGSCLGFLWFNARPAEVFMGDTGSLALGGAIGTISVIIKHEITLSIIGGIFVLETMSVIAQVFYFKKTGGERLFLMAPLHHHFEKKGWEETKVVIRFWIISIIFAFIGLSSLKLR